MKKGSALTLLILMVLFFSGPAEISAQRKDTKLVLDEIEKLAAVLSGLDKKIGVMSGEISILSRRVEMIEDRLNALSLNQADQGQNRESTLLTLQFLREELNDLKTMIIGLGERVSSGNHQAGENESQSAQDRPAQTPLPRDPSAVYYAAYSDYLKENYNLAIQGFQQFIQAFPESGLADNAYYWIGECYYAQKKFQEAAQTFEELMQKYPSGDKYPAAALKKAYALIAIGRQSDGVRLLKEVSSRFPLSEEASLAQQKLREINE